MPNSVRITPAASRDPRGQLRRTAHGRRWISVACVLVGLVSTGCSLDVSNPPSEVAWTAMIGPLPDAGVAFFAQVAMTSTSGETLISIAFAETEPNLRFDWAIQYGTCDDPAGFISLNPLAFPAVTIGLDGMGDLIVFLQVTLSDATDYSVVIFDDLSAQEFDLVGCAEMEVVEDPDDF